jgi:hypothetical protein
MKNKAFTTMALLMLTVLLTIGGGFALAADSSVSMTPELAAKTENVRKQQAQRITPAQRQAAADALKKRMEKLHQAQQNSPQPVQSAPVTQ